MFTPEVRARLRSELLESAAHDKRLSGAAITGSAAAGHEDQWSDIDLAFAVADPKELSSVLSDWTTRMYERHQALHHMDVHAGAWIYRVFLLADTLQVDLAFVPAAEFRPLAPTFQLIFGQAHGPETFPAPSASGIIGMGWLHALHARSSIARGKLWQAEYMISGVRDHALALACLRHGLPAAYSKGVDLLPASVTGRFSESLVRNLDSDELWRAFGAAVQGLVLEIHATDAELGLRIGEAVMALSNRPAGLTRPIRGTIGMGTRA